MSLRDTKNYINNNIHICGYCNKVIHSEIKTGAKGLFNGFSRKCFCHKAIIEDEMNDMLDALALEMKEVINSYRDILGYENENDFEVDELCTQKDLLLD